MCDIDKITAAAQPTLNKFSNIAAAVTGLVVNGQTGAVGGILGDSGFLGSLTCAAGTDCYKSRHNNFLLDKYNKKKTVYDAAPIELSRAEKNYYVFNKGEYGGQDRYDKLIMDRFATTAAQFKKNSIDKQQQFMSDLLQSIKQYQGALVFEAQMKNLLNLRTAEQNDYKKNILYYEKILQTSERKAVYENKSTDTLYSYQRVMIFLYYAGIVIFILFGNFIPDKLYLNYSVWLIIVILALIPLFLNLAIMWIFMLYDTVVYWVSDMPHKDVPMWMGDSLGASPHTPD